MSRSQESVVAAGLRLQVHLRDGQIIALQTALRNLLAALELVDPADLTAEDTFDAAVQAAEALLRPVASDAAP